MAIFARTSEQETNDKQHLYAPVTGEETEKTLQDESEVASELTNELQHLRRSCRNLKRELWALSIVAALCISLALGGVIWRQTQGQSAMYPQLLKTPVPQIPLTTHKFARSPAHASPQNPESEAAWDSLLPDGRGFVFIHSPEEYDIPPGEDTPWGPIYSIAVFHQLHCLGKIRDVYWKLVNGIDKNDTVATRHWADKLLGPKGEHINHCFDFVRQSLMCAGDMAVEWPGGQGEGKEAGRREDGWGVEHECKDWSYIERYMAENHFNASTNTQIAPPDYVRPSGAKPTANLTKV